jgi:Putative Flp pilus-assembly TadE/G-like
LWKRPTNDRSNWNERGVSLWLLAASMVVILGMAALAIDLGFLYVARNEAQRAADAAALAGAEALVSSGYTSGLVSQATATTLAMDQATAVGELNTVGGFAVQIQPSDVTVNFAYSNDPRVTVTVQQSSARGNALPTFFASIFGIRSEGVAAQASAEAYNCSSGGPPVATSCVKPWLIPNCDETRNTNNPTDSNCNYGANKKYDSFIDPNSGAILHPGGIAQGGVVGETLTFVAYTGNGKSGKNASKFYPVTISSKTGNYTSDIETCNPTPLTCGDAVKTISGNVKTTTVQGIEQLIGASGTGKSKGQDTINTAGNPPFVLTSGARNPYVPPGSLISSSNSIVTLPIYDGSNLTLGQDSGTVIGFMQLFVTEVSNNGTFTGIVLNLAGCGSSRSQGGQDVAQGPAPVAVRLVQ